MEAAGFIPQTLTRRKAADYGIVLIDKTEVDVLLPAAVREALRLP